MVKTYDALVLHVITWQFSLTGSVCFCVCELIPDLQTTDLRQLRRWRDAVAEHGAENALPGHDKSRDEG